MSKGLITLLAAAAAVALFFAVNIVSDRALSRARLDLTQNRLYTLSAGAKNVAAKLDEPVRLTLYFSEKTAQEIPQFRSYGERVKALLREFERASAGKINVSIVDPLPFSEDQDRADQAGLYGAPTGRGTDRLYFGLVGVNATDQRQVIPLFNPQTEEFLEYDVTRLIYLLSSPKKPVVGLLSQLPVEGTQRSPMTPRGGMPAWQVVNQMKDFFDVKTIAPDATAIPEDVKVLMLVHPKTLTDPTLYAIDQFVMRGGRLLAFVDPWCEGDTPPGMDPMQTLGMPKNSQLTRLFDAWGVEMVPERVVGDRKRALSVVVGSQARPEQVRYVAWLGLTEDEINRDDAVSGVLRSINVATAGALRKKDGAAIAFEPLLTTSDESSQIDAKEIQFIPDPKKLLADFKPGAQKQTIAARVSGKLKSAFPGGNPARPAPAEGQAPAADPNHLAESKEEAQAILVADADMLADRFWVQEERLGGISLGMRKVADNGDFVTGALDNLAGSSDLIGLRARGRFARPFEKVAEIQRDAEQRFRSREQELQQEIQKTEARLQELSRQRPEQGAALLTPEQKQEIDKLRATLVDFRKQQRDVQFQLNKDVEALGDTLKLINIGLVPVLVGAFALGLAAWRGNRRRTLVRAGDRS